MPADSPKIVKSAVFPSLFEEMKLLTASLSSRAIALKSMEMELKESTAEMKNQIECLESQDELEALKVQALKNFEDFERGLESFKKMYQEHQQTRKQLEEERDKILENIKAIKIEQQQWREEQEEKVNFKWHS